MALALRLRRFVTATSSLLRPLSITTTTTTTTISPPRPHFLTQHVLGFRSSSASLANYNNNYGGGEERKISPDEILFEGCDYNHWLITMEFPNDPKPTPEEMVETYVQTLAKVVGSVEEAKKRMYACSTTTYQGFQAVMTEEMSEKFRGLPGVVFILPDSYLYPDTKEYGGDKYDNGVITPRPPPVSNARQRYDRNQQQGNTSQQRNFQGNYQGPIQGGGRNYAPQQSYTPPGQDGRGYGPQGGGRNQYPQQNYAPQQNFAPGGRAGYQDNRGGPTPQYQRNINQGGPGHFNPQEQGNFPQGQGGGPRPGPSFGNNSHQPGAGYSGTSGYGGGNSQGAGAGFGGNNAQGSGHGESYSGPVGGQPEPWQGRQ